ncbi:NADP-dependent phosphogluconate dehydrogenase [Cohaesibacter celericrescens]|uniref:NADP-dependent phosphogluconate dehydrogenase n=1 Tax=Cohaesibacter celericrescens TaxID=2067669 RepID=UPI003562FF81
MGRHNIGIVGLGVMGRNLALNFADKGFEVAVFDPWEKARESFAEQLANEVNTDLTKQVTLVDSKRSLVDELASPRFILFMVKAGEPVDAMIQSFIPLLKRGDSLIDGGNSHFQETIIRERLLNEKGMHFFGIGISGGEEGARNGPSMMAGGNKDAYERARPMLDAIAAKYEDAPCCALVGSDGAGHFVKTVHNGIEYAIMQILSEAYMIMRDVYHLDAQWCGRVFDEWNETDLQSYLIEISAKVLQKKDDLGSGALIDMIMDNAGQKGTGRWSSEAALHYGVPAITIAESVFARSMAAMKDERVFASAKLEGPRCNAAVAAGSSIGSLRNAVVAAVIVAYAQGLGLITAASKEQKWDIDITEVAKIWRNGCVIRASMLDDIAKAYLETPDLANLMCAPVFAQKLADCQKDWRSCLHLAIKQGVPIPALSSAVAYYDGYRSARLSANLLQGQRDFFGAHTYERIDREGLFHTQW